MFLEDNYNNLYYNLFILIIISIIIITVLHMLKIQIPNFILPGIIGCAFYYYIKFIMIKT